MASESKILRDSFRSLLSEQCPTSLLRELLEDPDLFPAELWRAITHAGWTSASYPAAFGGQDLLIGEIMEILIEAGRALLPGPFFSTAVLTPILVREMRMPPEAFDDSQGFAQGKQIATVGFSEAPFRFPTPTVHSRFTAESGSVTGVKRLVSDANCADVILLPAIRDLDERLVVVLVSIKQEAVRTTVHQTIDGRRQCTVEFYDAPVIALFEGPEDSQAALQRSIFHASAAVAALQVGGASKALEMSVSYARQRVQFGRPIGTFQAVSHRLVDIYCNVELGRALLDRAIRSLAAGSGSGDVDVAIAKIWCNEMYRTTTKGALQVHGGIGFTFEHDIHLYLRSAQGLASDFGTSAQLRRYLKQQGFVQKRSKERLARTETEVVSG